MENTFYKIVNSLYEYLTDNNIKTMVLGFSGGLDTTVTAYICNAVTKLDENINFICVYMPSEINSSEQDKRAIQLSSYLSNQQLVYNIDDDFNTLTKSFANNGSIQSEKQKGNLKSRLRMMYLYDIALQNKGIVIDSNNKTEKYLGFFSLHGNTGDIAPLSDLWKTDVYELLSYIGTIEKNENIKQIINKLISDKNKIIVDNDNNDKITSLTYVDIDIILKRIINARFLILDSGSLDTFIKSNYMTDLNQKYGKQNISMIIRRYFNSHYKRKQLPIKINILQ